MNNDDVSLDKRKNLLDALAPQRIQEAIGSIKKKFPKPGVNLVKLAQTLVVRRSNKK